MSDPNRDFEIDGNLIDAVLDVMAILTQAVALRLPEDQRKLFQRDLQHAHTQRLRTGNIQAAQLLLLLAEAAEKAGQSRPVRA